MSGIREKILAALAKPLPEDAQIIHDGVFCPWEDVISGIYGCYSSESDNLMISAMEACQSRTTYDIIHERGFAAEFMFYVLAGHGLIEYGTSPRGGFPAPEIADLWQQLIDKWKAYRAIAWP